MTKAIPTTHNGRTYRSRTEARWAVFFESIGVDARYEPEGYDLGKYGWYLPDFFLPDLDCFVEIKPDVYIEGRQSPTGPLAAHTDKRVFTFSGSPKLPSESFSGVGGCCDFPNGWDDDYFFCTCPVCGAIGIEFDGRADRINCQCRKSTHGDKGYNANSTSVRLAVRASMDAFSHHGRRRRSELATGRS